MDTLRLSTRRVRRSIAALAGALALLLVAAPSAWACSCIGYSFEEAVEAADLIAEAEVIDAPDNPEGDVTYTVAVDRVWKGEQTRTILLTTRTDVASCGLGILPEGHTLMLWASGSDGEYSMAWCAYPTESEGDDAEKLTELFGEPTDLTDQPVEKPTGDKGATSEPAESGTASEPDDGGSTAPTWAVPALVLAAVGFTLLAAIGVIGMIVLFVVTKGRRG